MVLYIMLAEKGLTLGIIKCYTYIYIFTPLKRFRCSSLSNNRLLEVQLKSKQKTSVLIFRFGQHAGKSKDVLCICA